MFKNILAFLFIKNDVFSSQNHLKTHNFTSLIYMKLSITFSAASNFDQSLSHFSKILKFSLYSFSILIKPMLMPCTTAPVALSTSILM